MERVARDFLEIAKRRDSLTVLFFGAGEIGLRTAKKFFRPDWTIDNSPSLWGGAYGQLDDIRAPDSVLTLLPEVHVVICSAAEDEMRSQLLELGVDETRIFVSPYAKAIGPSVRLAQLEASLLVGSAGPANQRSNEGAGLYHLKIKGEEITQTKVLSGQVHGVVDWTPGALLASTDTGVFSITRDTLEVDFFAEIPTGVRPHGLVWNPDLGMVNVIANNRDALMAFDPNGAFIRLDYLLRGGEENGQAHHHMNDLAYHNGLLYVSMFSFSGSWKGGVYDGGVFAFDAKTLASIGPVVSGAQMPHSVTFEDDQMWFCNSLPGMLTKGEHDFEIRFPTFCRGLAFAGDFVFVGASRNRNSQDAPVVTGDQIREVASGVYVTSTVNRMARFIPMKGQVPEIHCVFSLDNDGKSAE